MSQSNHGGAYLRIALTFLVAATIVSCATVGPNFEPLKPDAPEAWEQALGDGLSSDPLELVQWWKMFEDPVLDGILEHAIENNNDLRIAALRVLESQAQLGIASGQKYPQTQVLFGDATYVNPPDKSLISSSYWQYDFGASISWELDFWGRFRRGIEASEASYLASVAEFHQARILLIAAVVDTYAVIRTTQEQLRIARENLEIQQRSFEIADVMYRNGADSELDVQQAQTLLLATKASIPALEAGLKQAKNAMSSLLGENPGGIDPLLADSDKIPTIPDNISIGFPAQMLRRRPDVHRAEFLAQAQNALVGLAAADLYPSFSLKGSIGVSAGGPGDSDFGDLFDSNAVALSVGPSFVWPFLNYGRIKNNVRVQDARLQQALISYRETVLQAARETEDAMAAYMGTREQSVLLAETVKSAKRSNALSTLRYREGFSDYQRVLDAQQALFSQQQRYVTSMGDAVRSLVALFKALGGGWQGSSPEIDSDSAEAMRNRTDWGEMINAPQTMDTANQN